MFMSSIAHQMVYGDDKCDNDERRDNKQLCDNQPNNDSPPATDRTYTLVLYVYTYIN